MGVVGELGGGEEGRRCDEEGVGLGSEDGDVMLVGTGGRGGGQELVSILDPAAEAGEKVGLLRDNGGRNGDVAVGQVLLENGADEMHAGMDDDGLLSDKLVNTGGL